MKNIILDLSGACSEEGLDRFLPDAEKLDLTSLEGTNCYCDGSAAAVLRSERQVNFQEHKKRKKP